MIGPPSNIDAIIPDPEFVLLKSAVAKLRIELSMLVLERDELVHHECKNIEAAYMLALGALEYKVFEAECALARLKRKTTLIQARVNRREKIAITEIEAQLDAEFTEYKAKLEAMIEDMNKALARSKNKLLTADESRELKKLYHAIVKALHPDLNPGLGGAKRRLFENAVAAYENGDLEALQTIAEMISEPDDISAVAPDAIARLSGDQKRLKELSQKIRDEIEVVKSKFPYTIKTFLKDPGQVKARKDGLEKLLGQINAAAAEYEAKIKAMTGTQWAV
jgi:hypothetical protein